ncbi:MAG: hypothetical protein GY856_36805 [bacterium]|nr:hypothetical protein [bacterium]
MKTVKGSVLIQYLDTAGDGSGTTNIIADHSGAAEEFYIEVPPNRKYILFALTVIGADAAGPTSGGYLGAGALTNGITLEKRNTGDDVLIDFTPEPVKAICQWSLYGGTGTSVQLSKEFRNRLDFVAMLGAPLELLSTEKLVVTVEDDFTAQTDTRHQFLATGLEFSDV